VSEERAFKEPRERFDYAHVVNAQLNRVARARSFLVSQGNAINAFSLDKAFSYVKAVEALHAILLPRLRGESKKYLRLARKALAIECALANARNRRERRELEAKLAECARELGGEEVGEPLFLGEISIAFADKALEEMLSKLDGAGLLLSERTIKVGFI